MSAFISFRYKYSIKGTEPYWLEVRAEVNGAKATLTGCSLFKLSGRYVGEWAIENMPVKLTQELRKLGKETFAYTDWEVNPDQ